MQSTSSWDAIVVGAGPAGAVASYLLACKGLQVLLVDAKRFPRTKVCGGCLNRRAITALESIGLGGVLRSCDSEPFSSVRIHQDHRWAEVSLPQGLCVTRSTFDTALVEAAVDSGVTFVSEARCKVLPMADCANRSIQWASIAGDTFTASAPIVLACDGLGNPSLSDLNEIGSVVAHHSRIGLGAVLDCSQAVEWLPRHGIMMAVADYGYVGLARAELGRLIIAAAVDPTAVSRSRSPAIVLRQMLDSVDFDSVFLDNLTSLRGTPPITQHATSVAAERLLLVGDSAGYIEPITGEGMAAAIEGAILVAPLAHEAAERWSTEMGPRWQNQYSRRIRSRQIACRSIAWVVRHPRVLRWSLSGLATQPSVGAEIGKWIGNANDREKAHAT